jgi:hypothetical protein
MKRNACRPVLTQGILLNQCYERGKEVTDDRETKCNKPAILPESDPYIIHVVISYPSNATIVTFFDSSCARRSCLLHFTVTHQLALLTFRLAVQVLVIW